MTEPAGRQSRLRTLAGFAISLIAIAGCLWWASRQSAPTFPRGVGHVALLVLAVAVYGAATLLRGLRWDAILRYLRLDHQRFDAYALTTVGYMGNTFLPARGGELMRIFLLAERSKAQRREVLGSILSERLLDAAVLAALFVVLSLAGAVRAPGGNISGYIAAGLLLIVLGRRCSTCGCAPPGASGGWPTASGRSLAPRDSC